MSRSRPPAPTPGRLLAVLGMVLALQAGCGRSVPPPPDADAAREALGRALDAWSRGEPPDSLRGGRPSIVVADHRWRGGYRLDRYEAEADDRRQGNDLRVRVTLWERDPDGAALTEVATYAIATGSPYTVIRDDEY